MILGAVIPQIPRIKQIRKVPVVLLSVGPKSYMFYISEKSQTSFHFCSCPCRDSWFVCVLNFVHNTPWRDTRRSNAWPWSPITEHHIGPHLGGPEGWENPSSLGALQMDQAAAEREWILIREEALWCRKGSICSADSSQWHQWFNWFRNRPKWLLSSSAARSLKTSYKMA